MPIDVNGTILTGGTSLTVTDASINYLYQQDSSGRVLAARDIWGTNMLPMFSVGLGATNTWILVNGFITFTATTGNGYYNIGSCYSTATGRFTVPWTGLYLCQQNVYIYNGNGAVYNGYGHPLFTVNGSSTTRRGAYTPYRIRHYGLPGSYGNDTDCCELMYLTAGDYVQVYFPTANTMYYYDSYSSWSGAYLGA